MKINCVVKHRSILQENSSGCPAAKDVSFWHLFYLTSNLVADRADVDRTISDICNFQVLSVLRCKTHKKCGRGRRCCSVSTKTSYTQREAVRNEVTTKSQCKLCIFVD